MSLIPIQQILKDLCEESETVEFRNNYSGRGMMGDTCVGITGSISECMQLIAEAIIEGSRQVNDIAQDPSAEAYQDLDVIQEEFEQQVRDLMMFQRDNLGYDVILYWIGLEPWIELEEGSGISEKDFDDTGLFNP